MIPPSRAPVTTTSLRPCLAERQAAAGASARAIADGLYGLYANPRSMDSKRGAGYLVRQSSGHAGLRASLSTVYNPFADGYARMSQNDPVSAFNPAAINDPDNPLNPMNRCNFSSGRRRFNLNSVCSTRFVSAWSSPDLLGLCRGGGLPR
jgi:hypothetical protein